MKRSTLGAAMLIVGLAASAPGTAQAAASWTHTAGGSGSGKAAKLSAAGSVNVACVRPNSRDVKIEFNVSDRSAFTTKFEVIRSTSATLSNATVLHTVSVTTNMAAAQTHTDANITAGTYHWAVRSVGGTPSTWTTNSGATSRVIGQSPNRCS